MRNFGINGEETVAVPAGTFSAISFSDDEWWAPGNGLVKTEDQFDGVATPYRNYHVLRELIAYGE